MARNAIQSFPRSVARAMERETLRSWPEYSIMATTQTLSTMITSVYSILRVRTARTNNAFQDKMGATRSKIWIGLLVAVRATRTNNPSHHRSSSCGIPIRSTSL